MPVHARSDFALAINQLCEERNISVEAVLETIQNAILAAYRKECQTQGKTVEIESFEAEISPESGETKIYEKTAKGKKDITPPGFGRIAAQTAKQVIMQKIREAEKQAVLIDYSAKAGTLVNGLVLRFDKPNFIVDIGKTEAFFPLSEQIPSEHYRVNQKYIFYLIGVKDTPKGQMPVVSRAHNGLIEELFRREIPEIQNASVKIKAIAREPGVRAKVAVFTEKIGVDPIGTCVGQKGVRIQAVTRELGAERVDLVQYNDDVAEYVRSSLSPAKNLKIEVNEENKNVKVVAQKEELAKAIGGGGVNVRLTASLTNYQIDIEGEAEGDKISGRKLEEEVSKNL